MYNDKRSNGTKTPKVHNTKAPIKMFEKPSLFHDWKKLPEDPGVYLFKDKQGSILYVGKAQSLRKRVYSYAKLKPTDWKGRSLLKEASNIEFRITRNSTEALILEAKLIQAHQPKYNISLKGGKPFLFFLFTQTSPPEMLLVRDKKQKGEYIGPFIHKRYVRKTYELLTKIFRLKLCHKRIENGCLYYHTGQCPGSCRSDFNLNDYKERLLLTKKILQKGPNAVIKEIENQIEISNKNCEFERSKILYSQLSELKTIEASFYKNFQSTSPDEKHIWLMSADKKILQIFSYEKGIVRKKRLWLTVDSIIEEPDVYIRRYYTEFACPDSIFTNFTINERSNVKEFLEKWHNKHKSLAIIDRIDDNPPDFVLLSQLMAEKEIASLKNIPAKLAELSEAHNPIKVIDCFDISHKQGLFMVGACIRFKDGQPDKDNFRLFKIKTVSNQNDYAALREIVSRRYKNATQDLPDLILIDGGKGQFNSVKDLVGKTPLMSLAKKEERLFCDKNLQSGIKLDPNTAHGAMLIALRDYTHHFAISYHRKLFTRIVPDLTTIHRLAKKDF